MKTIEELAKECGGYIETGENDEHLEALCKAYMQDRLKSLEPVGYISEWDGDISDIGQYLFVENSDETDTEHTWVKVYDISSLLEKE